MLLPTRVGITAESCLTAPGREELPAHMSVRAARRGSGSAGAADTWLPAAAHRANMLNSLMNRDSAQSDAANGDMHDDLRQQTASALLERIDAVTADTVAIFRYSGAENLDADYCLRLGELLTQQLAI